MDNLTPEVLKALSEAATPEEWRDTSLWPWKQAGVVDADGLHVATFSNVLDRDLALALVNAYRAGLLVHVDAEPEYRFADLYVEALAEIKATVDGQSDQPVKDIVYGLLAEIRLRADAVDTKGWDNG